MLHMQGIEGNGSTIRRWQKTSRAKVLAVMGWGLVLAIGIAKPAAGQCEIAKLTALDGAPEDYFGGSVSIDGDTAVVGSPWDDGPGGLEQGSAYVFVHEGSSWVQRARLTASDGAARDGLGWSVSISGDTVVVGACGDLGGPGPDGSYLRGSAYVFVKPTGGWPTSMTETAKLTGSEGDDGFGCSVSIDGDTVVIGAILGDCPGGTNQGAAYVFVREGATWTQQAKLTASGAAYNDQFGVSVSLDGDTALIGACGDDLLTGMDKGAAYVFVREGTSWVERAELVASDGSWFDRFGTSVSISGDTALVSAVSVDPLYPMYLIGKGMAYVFEKGSGWDDGSVNQVAKLTASDGDWGDFFGFSVCLSGETAFMGAFGDDGFQGSAYVFKKGTGWANGSANQVVKLTATDAAAGDVFGYSVAVGEDSAVIGALGDDGPGGNDQGSAYVFSTEGFTDEFTDDAYTHNNWTFFDIEIDYQGAPPIFRDATAVAGGGVLNLSSAAADAGYDVHYTIGLIDQEFHGSYARMRTAVRWTQDQLNARLIKGLYLRTNLTRDMNIMDLTYHILNLDPGSAPSLDGPNKFSLRRFVNGGEIMTYEGPNIHYQADVVYNVEFGISGDYLWGKLWTGNNYCSPIAEVSATNSDIPWGQAYGNVRAGLVTDNWLHDAGDNLLNGHEVIVNSSFLVNSQFGNVFEAAEMDVAPADCDGDGVGNTEEQGPDGSDPDYDGNNDSVPDAEQENVASLHTNDGESYVTLASPNGTSLGDVEAIAPPAGAPEFATFPYECFGFRIEGVGVGGAATVTLDLPGNVPTYYKYGPTAGNPSDHWYEFGYDGTTGAVITGSRVTLHLVDGQRGDHDLAANGVIVDPGGPGAWACNATPADLDGDEDVDGFDFLTFSNCYNGSNKAPLSGCEKPCADLETDGDVDGFDFLTFSNCFNGSNNPPRCP